MCPRHAQGHPHAKAVGSTNQITAAMSAKAITAVAQANHTAAMSANHITAAVPTSPFTAPTQPSAAAAPAPGCIGLLACCWPRPKPPQQPASPAQQPHRRRCRWMGQPGRRRGGVSWWAQTHGAGAGDAPGEWGPRMTPRSGHPSPWGLHGEGAASVPCGEPADFL